MKAKDALIEELLGDVGKLDDRIKTLPVDIENALYPAVARLEALETNLKQADHNICKSINSVKQQIPPILNQGIADTYDALRIRLADDLKVIVRDSVANGVRNGLQSIDGESIKTGFNWLYFGVGFSTLVALVQVAIWLKWILSG